MKLPRNVGRLGWIGAAVTCLVLALSLMATGPHVWGDVPTWIATVGTLGSFWVALAIFYGSVRDKRYAPARLVSVYTVRSGMVDRSQSINVWNGKGYTAKPVTVAPATQGPEGVPPALLDGLASEPKGGPSRTVKRVKYAIENAGEHAIHHIRIDHGYPDASSIRPLSRSYLTLRPHGALRPVFHFESDLDIDGLGPRVYFTDAMGRRWMSEPGIPVRPAGDKEGIYEGTGTLDFLDDDVAAHEGGGG